MGDPAALGSQFPDMPLLALFDLARWHPNVLHAACQTRDSSYHVHLIQGQYISHGFNGADDAGTHGPPQQPNSGKVHLCVQMSLSMHEIVKRNYKSHRGPQASHSQQ
jgi:hypothetical protein